MKIQCSCGTKYNIEVTPEMAQQRIQFVCGVCGRDASDYVTGLVQQELAASGISYGPTAAAVAAVPYLPGGAAAIAPPPPGYIAPPPPGYTPPSTAYAPPPPAYTPPAPVAVAAPPRAVMASAPASTGARMRVNVEAQAHAAPPPSPAGEQRCLKHGGELATRKCFVCSKPICPKCMELFGYLCSPLCKAKAESHGLDIPVFEGQKSVIEARLWRKTVRVATTVCAALALLCGVWIWYRFFGSMPKPIFSVHFPEAAYSGQSVIAGKDQIIFLHGGTLARHDMKQKKEIWSLYLVDKSEIERGIAQMMKHSKAAIDRANSDDPENVPKMPDADEMRLEMERGAAASLQLRVVGQNIWVQTPGKLIRYDYDNGKPVKEIPLKNGFANLMHRGDELLLLDEEQGKQNLTRINLNTCESRTDEIAGPKTADTAGTEPSKNNATRAGAGGTSKGSSATAGLPIGMPGKDAGRALDPAKVAQQAQNLSYPGKIALPAVLANSRSQERTLKELNDTGNSPAPQKRTVQPEEPFLLIPTQDGFVRFNVKLLEEKLVSRTAMKAAAAKSALSGEVTAGKSMDVANEILNEMQRERGGDTIEEDESRYQVKLSNPDGSSEWSGEVIGHPQLYPLQTVNVVAANKSIIVLDKNNQQLWKSSLTYNVVGGLDESAGEETGAGHGPCVEHKDTLYVFDQGVLSAFDLKTGNARWRVPSVGIAGLFFDEKGMLYVNTTDANPDTIKFSRQIDISQRQSSMLLKIDPKNGKILWTAQPGGWVNYVSGKFIYSVQSYTPDAEEGGFGSIAGMGGGKAYLRIKRINPSNGRVLWEHYEARGPLDVEFDKNTIRLVFKKEVEVLRFLSL